jgi:hypothetical protein
MADRPRGLRGGLDKLADGEGLAREAAFGEPGPRLEDDRFAVGFEATPARGLELDVGDDEARGGVLRSTLVGREKEGARPPLVPPDALAGGLDAPLPEGRDAGLLGRAVAVFD